MTLVAWPHCSCPPSPLRNPKTRERCAATLPRPSGERKGRVTILFSTSKARVEFARRSAFPRANRRSPTSGNVQRRSRIRSPRSVAGAQDEGLDIKSMWFRSRRRHVGCSRRHFCTATIFCVPQCDGKSLCRGAVSPVLKLWNESRTKRARIADSTGIRVRSRPYLAAYRA